MTGRIHFISAGAGSGKTQRLTQLLHEALTAQTARPEGVMAVTFTRKAAAELRERVRSRLFASQAHGLADALGQARIGTVHAVCGQLLERFAYAAGLAPGQQVLDEDQGRWLIRTAIDRVQDGPEVASLLEIAGRLGRSAAQWREELQTLIDLARANAIEPAALPGFAERNAAALLAHFPPPATAGLSAALEQALQTALPALQTAATASGKKNSAAYLAHAQTLLNGLRHGDAPWSAWVKLAKLWPEAGLKPLAEPLNALAARVAEHPRFSRISVSIWPACSACVPRP